MRGLQLLKDDGLMVYSTCSFNPMESECLYIPTSGTPSRVLACQPRHYNISHHPTPADEAVVAEILRRCAGSVELVDVSSCLPGLVRSPGLLTWRVFDSGLNEYASFADVCSAARSRLSTNRVRRNAGKIAESLFPPIAEVAADMHLERCMRLLPHTQDTGGFFVALLRKRSRLPFISSRMHRPRFAMDANADVAETGAAVPLTATAVAGSDGAAPAAVTITTADVKVAEDDANSDVDCAIGRAGAAANDEHAANDVDEPTVAEAATAGSKRPRGDEDEENGAAIDGAAIDGESAALGDVPLAAPAMSGSEKKMREARQEQWIYRHLDAETSKKLSVQFGMSPAFPQHLLLTRSEMSKTMTLVAESIAHFIVPRSSDGPRATRFKLVNSGLKVFDWNSGSVSASHTYRLLQEGIHLVR
jgi:hypothetical protein